eukprot:14629497-Heterocapsa_arctica.AAC.1
MTLAMRLSRMLRIPKKAAVFAMHPIACALTPTRAWPRQVSVGNTDAGRRPRRRLRSGRPRAQQDGGP